MLRLLFRLYFRRPFAACAKAMRQPPPRYIAIAISLPFQPGQRCLSTSSRRRYIYSQRVADIRVFFAFRFIIAVSPLRFNYYHADFAKLSRGFSDAKALILFYAIVIRAFRFYFSTTFSQLQLLPLILSSSYYIFREMAPHFILQVYFDDFIFRSMLLLLSHTCAAALSGLPLFHFNFFRS